MWKDIWRAREPPDVSLEPLQVSAIASVASFDTRNCEAGLEQRSLTISTALEFPGLQLPHRGLHGRTSGVCWNPMMRGLPTLVCCVQRREDVFTFRRRGRSHPRPALSEPAAKIGRRPSLFMLWRIGGLWSLHVQGQQKERVRGCGQGRLLKPILVPEEVYEQADRCPW